jgi:hypothetical protein
MSRSDWQSVTFVLGLHGHRDGRRGGVGTVGERYDRKAKRCEQYEQTAEPNFDDVEASHELAEFAAVEFATLTFAGFAV